MKAVLEYWTKSWTKIFKLDEFWPTFGDFSIHLHMPSYGNNKMKTTKWNEYNSINYCENYDYFFNIAVNCETASRSTCQLYSLHFLSLWPTLLNSSLKTDDLDNKSTIKFDLNILFMKADCKKPRVSTVFLHWMISLKSDTELLKTTE